jgi:Ca2+-binding EF-hand superfamily protein
MPEYRISAYKAYTHDYFEIDGTEKVKIKLALRMFRGYPKYDSIQKAIIRWFVDKAQTKTDKEEYMKTFYLLNRGSDGQLKVEEMRYAFYNNGFNLIKEDEINAIFSLIDLDG